MLCSVVLFINPAGHQEDELGADFEEAFEGFNHSHTDIGNDPFKGVEPMGVSFI